MDLVVGTFNKHKFKEISVILKDISVNLIPLYKYTSESVEETGSTLKENAYIKARYAYDITKLPSIADDTGLFVDALNGSPGIYAARYAGENATYEENVNKLLKEMEGKANRKSKFVTVVCYYDGEKSWFFEGILEGEISEGKKGYNGFGYDPIFYLPDKMVTLAELSSEDKNTLSHRFNAFKKLKNFLQGLTNGIQNV